jgi:hypothetical protein
MATVWLRVTANYADRQAEVRVLERFGVSMSASLFDIPLPESLSTELTKLGDLQRVTYEIVARSTSDTEAKNARTVAR